MKIELDHIGHAAILLEAVSAYNVDTSFSRNQALRRLDPEHAEATFSMQHLARFRKYENEVFAAVRAAVEEVR